MSDRVAFNERDGLHICGEPAADCVQLGTREDVLRALGMERAVCCDQCQEPILGTYGEPLYAARVPVPEPSCPNPQCVDGMVLDDPTDTSGDGSLSGCPTCGGPR